MSVFQPKNPLDLDEATWYRRTVQKNTVTQCRLVEVASSRHHTAFIDSRFAVGAEVVIDDLPGLWRVVERYAASTTPESEVIKRSWDHTRQREASDV